MEDMKAKEISTMKGLFQFPYVLFVLLTVVLLIVSWMFYPNPSFTFSDWPNLAVVLVLVISVLFLAVWVVTLFYRRLDGPAQAFFHQHKTTLGIVLSVIFVFSAIDIIFAGDIPRVFGLLYYIFGIVQHVILTCVIEGVIGVSVYIWIARSSTSN